MRFYNAPKENETGLLLLADFLGLPDTEVAFEKGDGMSLCEKNGRITVGYETPRDALRALSFLPAFLKDKQPIRQKADFDTLCVMADCSRNAVINVQSVKELLLYMAAMGFNALMLYTEDTYEIPEYPYFGHLRGRYTKEELKELDAFGASLGIELIPCIQTLAHLNAIFDWPDFAPYHDIDDILLADDERVYDLIECMFKNLRECFSSRRLHVGMDEAHHLGRGRHTDLNGPSVKSDIMLRHLSKVIGLCKKYDFEPVMWSDMFFRMQFGGAYRVKEGELSGMVTDRIPPEVGLCYWDYYTHPSQTEYLSHMFSCHEKIGNPIWFAGGAWGWTGVTPKNRFSVWVTPTHLRFARQYNVRNVIATAWGDDGAECAVFAVLPSLLQYAEICYGNESALEERSQACFGIGFDDFMTLDAVGSLGEGFSDDYTNPPCVEKSALFNDPMIGKMDADLAKLPLEGKYAKDAECLAAVPDNKFGYLFRTQLAYAKLLDKKTFLSRDIKAAYRGGDKQALRRIAADVIPETVRLLEDYIDAFRTQWYTVNKPFGFEIQELRLGGMKERLAAAARRLTDYADDKIDRLEELEQPDLPIGTGRSRPAVLLNSWRRAYSAGVLSHS